MSVMKYKDPTTGEVKKVGAPKIDTYTKTETDTLLKNKADTSSVYTKTEADDLLSAKAPAYAYGTDDLTAGTSPLETGKLYFVYE